MRIFVRFRKNSRMIYIYNFVAWLSEKLIALAALRNPKAKQIIEGRKEIAQRLREHIDPEREVLLMHVSSLGEFEQGRPILEAFREAYPEWQIVLSFFSPSGYNVRKDYGGADVVVYLPTDTKSKMSEFLDLMKPDLALFVKYDLWPTLLHLLKERGVPTFLISAIFRESQLFFKPYGKWYRNLLTTFEQIFVQNETSQNLLSKVGIDCVVAGDTRFDRVWQIAQKPKVVEEALSLKVEEGTKLLVAGSTWAEDEDLLLDYFNRRDNLRLIIAPHEVDEEHILSICSKIKRPFLRYSKRSEVEEDYEYDCLVIDEIGLLSSLYAYADMAYIGGGFGAGIHNTVEPAVYGLPIIFAPNKVQKFREAVDMLVEGGAFKIHNQAELDERLDCFLNSEVERLKASKKAQNYVAKQLGASAMIMQKLKDTVEKRNED